MTVRRARALFLMLVGIGSLIVFACGGNGGPSPPFTVVPTPTLAPLPTATLESAAAGEPADHQEHEADAQDEHVDASAADAAERGREAFVSHGCSACHGVDARGTQIAPALPGHTGLQVRRQTRGPIGFMPVFGRNELSSEELDDIVAFVTSLGGAHVHGDDPGASPAEEVMSHHLMAITAFEGDNIAEALHHIEHVIGLVEGEHLGLMQEALAKTQAGETHEAQHMIEAMMADVAPPGETLDRLHLKLALSALRVGELDESVHHLEHAATLMNGDRPENLSHILDELRESQPHHAEELLSEALGLEPQGIDDLEHVDGDEHGDDG